MKKPKTIEATIHEVMAKKRVTAHELQILKTSRNNWKTCAERQGEDIKRLHKQRKAALTTTRKWRRCAELRTIDVTKLLAQRNTLQAELRRIKDELAKLLRTIP